MKEKEKLVVEIPDLVGLIADDPVAIGRNAVRLSRKRERLSERQPTVKNGRRRPQVR